MSVVTKQGYEVIQKAIYVLLFNIIFTFVLLCWSLLYYLILNKLYIF